MLCKEGLDNFPVTSFSVYWVTTFNFISGAFFFFYL